MKGGASQRKCVFCGGPANSREHVFAKRLCARARITMLKVDSGLYTQNAGKKSRPPHQLDDVTVRHVCRVCNNGWMNDLEAWFERRMGCLIEPNWPRLAIDFIQATVVERHSLALWCLKTAVTFNLAAMKGNLRVDFPSAAVTNISDGKLPDHCWVDVGCATDRAMGAVISRCFRTVNGGKYNPSQLFSGFGFHFVVQLNHLLIRIALAPGADVTYDDELGGRPWRVYPEPDKVPIMMKEYRDVMQFMHSLVLTTRRGCKGNVS